MFFFSNAAGIAGSIIVSVRLSLGLLYACSGPRCRQPSRRGRIDRGETPHNLATAVTKPHIGLAILPLRRCGFPLRDRLTRSSTVVWATFSTRAIARMRSPF
jgi:hypothetical protein